MPMLDFVQTPFAKVVGGLETVQKISVLQRNQNRAPLTRTHINGITIKEKGKKKGN